MLTESQILRILAAELDDAHGKTAVELGQHPVQAQISLQLAGSVEQLPAQLVSPSVRLPLVTILAMVCQRGGLSVTRMVDSLVEAALEAHEHGEPAGEWVEHSKAAERKARELIAAKVPKVERSGQLRRIVEVTGIQINGAVLKPPPARRRGKAQ